MSGTNPLVCLYMQAGDGKQVTTNSSIADSSLLLVFVLNLLWAQMQGSGNITRNGGHS